MHNSFWGWTDDDCSPCTVVGYAGQHAFAAGVSKYTYIIEAEGFHYVARHTAVADAIVDPAVRRRVRKLPPPRLLR